MNKISKEYKKIKPYIEEFKKILSNITTQNKDSLISEFQKNDKLKSDIKHCAFFELGIEQFGSFEKWLEKEITTDHARSLINQIKNLQLDDKMSVMFENKAKEINFGHHNQNKEIIKKYYPQYLDYYERRMKLTAF